MHDSDSDAERLAEQVRQAVGSFVRAVRGDTDTPRTAQSDTLDLLDREGDMTVAALAKRRNVRHQTMRLVVAQLEAAGLVERRDDPADRRAQIVAISRAGRQSLLGSRGARSARIGALIRERLSPQERDHLRAAVALLDRMSARSPD